MSDAQSHVDMRVTDDGFLNGRLRILQPAQGPRTAIDALFLAAAVPIKPEDKACILEAGAGTGVVSLALANRARGSQVVGVEIQSDLVDLARQNAERNGLKNQVRIIEADLTAPGRELAEKGLEANRFDHSLANPPFHPAKKSRSAPDAAKNLAHMSSEDTLERWCRFLAAMTAPKGTVTLINRPDALPEILKALDRRFGHLTLCPLYPDRNGAARRIIVQGIKGSRGPLAMLPGLVLHDGDNSWTLEARAVLEEGAQLDLLTQR